MDRILTIETLVRPIRKLYVLEPDDLESFISFIELSTDDVNGIFNIVLINDAHLFSDNNVTFVRRHDPDIIVNYSRCEDARLYECYRTVVRNRNESHFNPIRFQTPLALFQNVPSNILNLYKIAGETFKANETVWTVLMPQDSAYGDETAISIKSPPGLEEIFFSIHCGRLDKEGLEQLEISLFRETIVKSLETSEDFSSAMGDHDNNFLYLPAQFSGYGPRWSIYEIDHNPNHYFNDKPALIFSRGTDLKSMAYFWNTRATYPKTKLVWMPIELAERYQGLLEGFGHYCSFTDEVHDNPMLKPLLGKMTEIDASKLYFQEVTGWDSFKSVQNVYVKESRLRISHAASKLLSNMGLSNCMFEVRGLSEARLPISSALGELFIEDYVKDSSFYLTSRISRDGWATSTSGGSPMSDEDLIVDIIFPSDRDVFQTLFKDHGLEIRETKGTKIVDRILDLVGGVDNLNVLLNPEIFDLLVKLTPPRIEKIAKELMKALAPEMDDARVVELLQKNIEELKIINSNKSSTLNDMYSMVPSKNIGKKAFYDRVQGLYEKRILLRGKNFRCQFCEGDLWFPFELIKEDNKCYRCNQAVHIPVSKEETPLDDSFRVNDLIANAVDQGVLAVLLTIFYLKRVGFYGTRFLYDCEVKEVGQTDLLQEVDVIFTFGRRLGLGEVKSDRGFELSQVDRIINIAARVNADLLIFTTLKGKDTEEVTKLTDHLTGKDLKIPAFIIPREELFSDKLNPMSEYFELRKQKTFPTGPIIIAP